MATTLHVSADVRPECIRPLRNIVASFARENGLSDVQVYVVKFCVSEAVSNAVKHAYPESDPGPVDVSAQAVGDELAVVVQDYGQVHDGKRSEDEGGGFGLSFIARLTDGCTFTATGDGTTVEMLFPLPRSKARIFPPGPRSDSDFRVVGVAPNRYARRYARARRRARSRAAPPPPPPSPAPRTRREGWGQLLTETRGVVGGRPIRA